MTDSDSDSTVPGAQDRARGEDFVGEPREAEVRPTRGADLARAALESARVRNAAAKRGANTGRTRAGSGSLRLKRRRWSGPAADRARDPQRLGDTVHSWLASADSGQHVAKATLFARWEQLVGTEIAAHAAPVSLTDGELVVQAESTAWATQLRLMAGRLMRRINDEIGKGTVTRIRTKGPTAPSWRFGNRHISGRGPRDTYG